MHLHSLQLPGGGPQGVRDHGASLTSSFIYIYVNIILRTQLLSISHRITQVLLSSLHVSLVLVF